MYTLHPDYGLIERTWESRLRERGLVPSRVEGGLATGLQRMELRRGETQVAEYDIDPAPGKGFQASVCVKVTLELPDWGEFEVRDLITQQGPSLDGALTACANAFMDETFPPLETLFTGKRPEGFGTGNVTVTSYTVGRDRAIKWDVVLGSLQVTDNPEGEVRGRLTSQPPLGLMFETLTGHLSSPRIHWCKVYGSSLAGNGLDFVCMIDGQTSVQAEAEMVHKFGEPPPGEWEFHQFFVIQPVGEATPEATADLRGRASAAFPEQKKRWWSRLFGA